MSYNTFEELEAALKTAPVKIEGKEEICYILPGVVKVDKTKAWCFRIDGAPKDLWIPKSQGIINRDQTVIAVKLWVIKKKGPELFAEDLFGDDQFFAAAERADKFADKIPVPPAPNLNLPQDDEKFDKILSNFLGSLEELIKFFYKNG